MNRIGKIFVAATVLAGYTVNAQDVDKKILNWYNGAKLGMSTDKAYAKLLADKKSEPVIVAVIDSGVDIEHEDLQGSIWVNKDEIAGNGIDDDKNGYVDDVNGWSFLGNMDGENIKGEQLEVTRLYVKYDEKFKGKEMGDISADDKADFEKYKMYRDIVEKQRSQSSGVLAQINQTVTVVKNADDNLRKHFGGDYTVKDLKKLKKKKPEMEQDISIMMQMLPAGGPSALQGAIDFYNGALNSHYNLDLNTRTITGDDPSNFDDKFYGSNDVEGPDAFHGTHVAGIIAATRGNNIGSDGVADNVQIMSVRAVPDGDERDKDVANAIIYAVDNGASIINMSFGKGFSWDKVAVDKAVKYACKKDVLLVHAAGNAAQNNDTAENYPRDEYFKKNGKPKGKFASCWMEIGALSWKDGADLPATFSNYGKKNVDLFAPGVAIYSTTPDDNYRNAQGTSMASPVVAGVAAILRSYFPNLTAQQTKNILMRSSIKMSNKVNVPGNDDGMQSFGALSVSGGIVNAYSAVKMAKTIKGEKK